jgi:hypothetical protein
MIDGENALCLKNATIESIEISTIGAVSEIHLVNDGKMYVIFDSAANRLEITDLKAFENSCFKCNDLQKYTNGYYQCGQLHKWINPEKPECNNIKGVGVNE